MNEDAKNLLNKLKDMKSCLLLSKIDKSSEGENKVLGMLYEKRRDVTAGSISAELKMSTARIAVILSSLEEKGLAEKYHDPHDRRKTLVRITEKGVKHTEELYEGLLEVMNELIESIGTERLNLFVDTLQEICDLAQEHLMRE